MNRKRFSARRGRISLHAAAEAAFQGRETGHSPCFPVLRPADSRRRDEDHRSTIGAPKNPICAVSSRQDAAISPQRPRTALARRRVYEDHRSGRSATRVDAAASPSPRRSFRAPATPETLPFGRSYWRSRCDVQGRPRRRAECERQAEAAPPRLKRSHSAAQGEPRPPTAPTEPVRRRSQRIVA